MVRESMDGRIISETTVRDACTDQSLPKMGVIEQCWETSPIPNADIRDRAVAAVDSLDLSSVPRGGTVAVGVGSRGISNLQTIVAGVIAGLRNRSYEPFVFPAMGSHGGATPDGQRETLAALGVTETSVGCEIRSTMETVIVGETDDREVPVHADANAVDADAIVPINRIKPHTDFSGRIESGLSKMLVVGMGKQRGAKTAHEWAANWSFRRMIPEMATLLIEALPIVGGIALVEDQNDDTAIIEGISQGGFLQREARLLERSYELLPTLPFDDLDVLILDRMGKDISGAGMDTNVIGRLVYGLNEPEPETPEIKRIFVRELTEASHGNAVGVGSADFIHADLLAAIDSRKTFVNVLTATSPRSMRIPPTVENDAAGLLACLSTIGVTPPEQARVIRAEDTSHLRYLLVSEPLVEATRTRDDLRVVQEPVSISFTNGKFDDIKDVNISRHNEK
ncbi:DUF362 domain-containing protein [Haladaptatus litoreus]|nr:DUF362 domain-containing protein [Haladaptatus litoreus]